MTTCVVRRHPQTGKIEVGTDGRISGGSGIMTENGQKIFDLRDNLCISPDNRGIYLFAGVCYQWNTFYDYLCSGKDLPNMDDMRAIFINNKQEVFAVEGEGLSTPRNLPIELPYAIGSGSKFALGVLLYDDQVELEEVIKIAAIRDCKTNTNFKGMVL